MKNLRLILGLLCIGLLFFSSCHDRELDMTVLNSTLYEGVAFDAVEAEDAWNVTVVQDDQKTGVELEYSTFLEEYLQVVKEGTTLKIGLTQHLNLPAATIHNATVYVRSLKRIDLEEAAVLTLDGNFTGDLLQVEMSDASVLREGQFLGDLDLRMSNAAVVVDFIHEGARSTLELEDASVFKGSLNVSGLLTMTVKEASRLTEYWGEIHTVEAIVSDASYLNMASSWINRMSIEVSDASEATVNVVASLEGVVADASKLYYSGNPILNVDCDETSIFQQVDYPNP